jgi:two-component system sensor histidine kinase DesK
MRLLPDNEDVGWTPYAWLIYLAFFFLGPIVNPRTTGATWAATALGTAIFLVLYFRGHWARGRELVAIVVALALLGAVYYPFNPGGGCFFIYACSFAGELPKPRRAICAIAMIELLTIVESIAFHVHPANAVWPLVFNLIVGGVNMHFAERGRAHKRLRLAQDEVEHLAKVAERERIARDLHDVLGHTLSVIILKSELASKLAERDVDRARAEIRDVERISREALAQVRAAIRGYRAGSLQGEADSARATLATAGVAVECELATLTVPPAYEAVLALALREAVTNIVRHADAHRCTIRLAAPCTLTIEDDGRGGNAAFGQGLSGMRERVESLGGTLVRDGARGTTLTIALPCETPPHASVAERSA